MSTTNTWNYLGFNYASWWNGSYGNTQSTEALGQLKSVGADTATIVSTYYLNGVKSSNIFSTNNTESLANVEKAVADAKNKGLSVWLKPHLDLVGGEFRGGLDPADRATFFSNYKKILLDYARLGQKYGAEALVLGTELNGVTKSSDRAAWLDIINSVKQVYSGKLTYAANWDAPDKIPFVDKLDMIGIDAYYPLTQNRNATVDQLVTAWTGTPEDGFVRQLTGGQSIVDWLEGISKSTGKPIVFTEAGFRSADGNAAAPYQFWDQNTVDFEEQSRLYQAFFKVFGGEAPQSGDVSWFDGAQLWSWYATADMNNDPSDTDYAILNKPAEAVFKQYAAQLLSGSPAPNPLPNPTPGPAPTPTPTPAPNPIPAPGTSSNDLIYEFKVTSDWGNGFSGDLLVTNKGTQAINNWTLEFNAPYAISQMWNAQINSLGNGRYETKAIASAPWNQEISPGETISFGYVGEAADPTAPKNFAMKGAGITSPTPAPATSPTPAPVVNPAPDPLTNPTNLKYEFKVTSDWGNGFSGDLLVTNTGSKSIDKWALNFKAPYAIGATWNAQITSLGSGQYQAKAIDSAPWNQVISPGETISFGYVGEAADPTSPSAFAMKAL
ncbi:MAG TPA: cellulose binding domain-containing protein [Leptolyngbyaceae cyanobacterium]